MVFLLLSLQLFFSLFNSKLTFFISLIMFWVLYIKSAGKESTYQYLFNALILSVPTSFTNVFGGSYSDLPVSWFNIFAVLIILNALLEIIVVNKKSNRKYYFLITSGILLSLFISLSLFNSVYLWNGLADLINFCLFVFLILAALNRTINIELSLRYYLWGVFVTTLLIVIQVLYYYSTKEIIGHVGIFEGRIAIGGIFADYSFLSLYLSTASIIYISLKSLKEILLFLYLNIFSVITSARTGIFSVLIIFVIYIFTKRESKRMKICKLGAFVLLVGLSVMIFKFARSSGGLDSANGRLATYNSGMMMFRRYPLLGVGLGFLNYSQAGTEFPHNIVIQLLSQTGIFGLFFSILFISNIFLVNKRFGYMLLGMLIGAMFIPDIMNSRFFGVVVMIAIADKIETEATYKRCEI